jgi:hypothetical protein
VRAKERAKERAKARAKEKGREWSGAHADRARLHI